MKKHRGVDLGKRGDGREDREEWGRGNCGGDVFERSIFNKFDLIEVQNSKQMNLVRVLHRKGEREIDQ